MSSSKICQNLTALLVEEDKIKFQRHTNNILHTMKVKASVLKSIAVAVTVGAVATTVATSCAQIKSLSDNKPKHEQPQSPRGGSGEFNCAACGMG
jgi:hypothetical protein